MFAEMRDGLAREVCVSVWFKLQGSSIMLLRAQYCKSRRKNVFPKVHPRRAARGFPELFVSQGK